MGSACECLDRTIAAHDEGYLTLQQYEELEAQLAIIRRMLTRLIERLRDRMRQPRAESRELTAESRAPSACQTFPGKLL